jgi:hypothetical protein
MYASVSHLIERITTVLAYATHHLNIANAYSGSDCYVNGSTESVISCLIHLEVTIELIQQLPHVMEITDAREVKIENNK